MAKLYFRYGAMNSGKSTALLQAAYNYEERGQRVLLAKPGVDTKGDDAIVSRLGVTRAADVTFAPDDEVRQGILLLARTEGIFTETAGGTTVGVLKKLVETGQLDPDAETVVINTGMGLKTLDSVADLVGPAATIAPSYAAFVATGIA